MTGETVLDSVVGPNAVLRVFIRKENQHQREVSVEAELEVVGLEHGGRRPLVAGKGQEVDSSEPQEEPARCIASF